MKLICEVDLKHNSSFLPMTFTDFTMKSEQKYSGQNSNLLVIPYLYFNKILLFTLEVSVSYCPKATLKNCLFAVMQLTPPKMPLLSFFRN